MGDFFISPSSCRAKWIAKMYLAVHEEGGPDKKSPCIFEILFSFLRTPSEEKSCCVGVLLAFIRAIAAHARPIHSQNLHRKYFWIKPKYYQIQTHSQSLQQKYFWIKPQYWQIQINSLNAIDQNQNISKYKYILRTCTWNVHKNKGLYVKEMTNLSKLPICFRAIVVAMILTMRIWEMMLMISVMMVIMVITTTMTRQKNVRDDVEDGGEGLFFNLRLY